MGKKKGVSRLRSVTTSDIKDFAIMQMMDSQKLR